MTTKLHDTLRHYHENNLKVTDFMTIEKYSHVMHIVSHVVGEYNESTNKAKAAMKALALAKTL